ncbi:hormone-sensitive lipase [Ancylostoma caninum]|uniref:Hormone-sensitive lipase n=1 Tax=Ancylostoma caninum TaxID=29170 RepID=A0A368FDQ2_ANCCA|nr:hormone-sensitive lipase [Ancylostoma caninum]
MERLQRTNDLVTQLQDIAPSYDYDENTPGNGYRSLVCICDTTVLHIISLQKTVSEQRGSFVFRLAHYCKELEAFVNVIHFLMDSLPLCIGNAASMPSGSLFPPLHGNYEKYHEMLRGLEQLDSTCFYGRPLGFQFSPSVNRIFRLIGIVLASYSLSWEKGHGPIGSIINTGRFFLSPEQRASRIIKVTKEADIDFCKGFWNLAELSNNMPKWFSPNMAINELREINWVGPISLETTKGGKVRIPEPSAHTGPRPVQIRVLSPVHRPHMSPTGSSNQQPASPYIVFHCHGGGYVATSSKSHETYLRMWAKLLNCTVVSVEYSLAPANPFPRPTEEVLFAYAWIVNNPQLVAYTGGYGHSEKKEEATDSAGHKSLQEYVEQVQKSQRFDFAIHKRSLSQSLADTAVLAAGHALDNLQDWLEKPSKEKQKLDRTISHKEPNRTEVEEPCERKSHILDLLNKSVVPRDPLISPMYASDDVIRQLPPVYFVVSMYIRRLCDKCQKTSNESM